MKSSFFMPFLAISTVAHLGLFGLATVGYQAPQFGVNQGASSMEVVLIKQEKPEPVREKKTRVMTAAAAEAPKVSQTEEKTEKISSNESAENLFIPEQYGSLTDFLQQHFKNPAPLYPELARENGWEGRVVLEVLVSKQGRAESVTVAASSGHSVLDQAALRTVRRWNFLPAQMGRFKFSSKIKVPIRFTLED